MTRILFLDDDPHVRGAIAESLREEGFEVVEVADDEAAMRELGLRAFDLALLDYVIPGARGDAIARRIEAEWPALPIALMTGYADFPALTGKGEGLPVIAKPISHEALVASVRAAMTGSPSPDGEPGT